MRQQVPRLIQRMVRVTPPITFLTVYAGAFVVALVVGALYPDAHRFSADSLPRIFLWVVSVIPLFFLAAHVYQWQTIRDDIRRIGGFYLQNVVLFAILYAFQVVLADPGEVMISNIDNPYHVITGGAERVWAGLGVLVDCLYFSVVTSTTLGYGDMSPQTRPLRLITMAQVMVSVWMVSVALGQAMSAGNKKGSEKT